MQATSYFNMLRTFVGMGTTLYIFIQIMTERGIPQEMLASATNSFLAVYVFAGFFYNRFHIAFEAFKDIACIRESHRANDPSVLAESSPKNRRIDDLSPEEAYRWTRFTKAQLHLLLLHLLIPEWLPSTASRWVFTGEEVLLVCLTRIATGDAFYDFIPSKFGGDAPKWSDALRGSSSRRGRGTDLASPAASEADEDEGSVRRGGKVVILMPRFVLCVV